MSQHQEIITTKIALMLGTITAGMTLADFDLILAIILKGVSILSFIVVLALNVDKLINKIKDWTK